MAKLITAAERITRARKMIQEARDIPVPEGLFGKSDLSYVAGVKDLLRQARELVRLIPMRAGISDEMKTDANQILQETDQVEEELLRS